MPVTVIYYHSVINKAMVFGTLQLFLIVEDNTLSKIDYNRVEARLHVSRKQRLCILVCCKQIHIYEYEYRDCRVRRVKKSIKITLRYTLPKRVKKRLKITLRYTLPKRV